MNDDHRIPCDPLLSACGQDETETLPLQTILDSLTYPFYIISVADYRVRWANAAARRMHEAGTGACYALTHQREQPCCGPEHPCPMQILRETGKPVVVEHIHQDDQGRRRVVEVHAFPFSTARAAWTGSSSTAWTPPSTTASWRSMSGSWRSTRR